MFEKLVIRNFQTHRKLIIQFDKQVTTIIGDSDIGKSAVLRALRWVCLNEPSGDDFVHWDAELTSVKLVFDGHVLIRKRGKGQTPENTYTLDAEELKAFKSGVPDQIKSLLNVSELNFQGQLDQHFWFSLTPGQISKELNKIVNLTLIDESLSRIAKEVRRSRIAVELAEQRVKEIRERRKELKWVVGADKLLSKTEANYQIVERNQAAVEGLRVILRQVKQYQLSKRRLKEATTTAQETEAKGAKAAELFEKVTQLELLLIQFTRTFKLSRKEIPKLELLDKLVAQHNKIKKRYRAVKQIVEEIKACQQSYTEISSSLKKYHAQLETLTKGRCPICGRKLSNGNSNPML